MKNFKMEQTRGERKSKVQWCIEQIPLIHRFKGKQLLTLAFPPLSLPLSFPCCWRKEDFGQSNRYSLLRFIDPTQLASYLASFYKNSATTSHIFHQTHQNCSLYRSTGVREQNFNMGVFVPIARIMDSLAGYVTFYSIRMQEICLWLSYFHVFLKRNWMFQQ